MNMDKMPTPETDAVEKEFTVDSKQNPQHRLALKSRNLERRLTIAREALERIHAFPYHPHVCEFARITLNQTAPKA